MVTASGNINSLIESSYLKIINEITINIAYLTSRRDKTRFVFMKKWYDRRIKKSNQLLIEAECGLNRVKASK